MRWFVLLLVIAIGLALGLPPDPHSVQQLHTNLLAYRLAIAALLIPFSLIWFMGFYAYAKLQEYSRPLKDADDGKAFRKIAIGMGALAFALIVPTIISLILNNIAVHNHAFKTASVILNNYIGLYSQLISFLLLFNGARLLTRTTKAKARNVDIRWHGPWFLLLAAFFTRLTIQNQYRGERYHLSVTLLVITVIVPTLYTWMIGLLAAYELAMYSKWVRGKLYKQASKYISQGVVVTILGLIAIQFVTLTIAPRYSHSLGAILLLDYILLLVVAAGLLLMSLGTKRLKKIEEV